MIVGDVEGDTDGLMAGSLVGASDGEIDGDKVGDSDGEVDGGSVGLVVVGASVGGVLGLIVRTSAGHTPDVVAIKVTITRIRKMACVDMREKRRKGRSVRHGRVKR